MLAVDRHLGGVLIFGLDQTVQKKLNRFEVSPSRPINAGSLRCKFGNTALPASLVVSSISATTPR